MPMQVFLYSNMMNSKNSGIAIPFLQVFEKRCHTMGVWLSKIYTAQFSASLRHKLAILKVSTSVRQAAVGDI